MATITCKFCKKQIGRLRRFADKDFCCREHRAKAGISSARTLRDRDDCLAVDDAVLGEIDAEAVPNQIPTKTARETPSPLLVLLMTAGLSIGAIVGAMLARAQPAIAGLKGFVQRYAAVRLSSDFHTRAEEWVRLGESGSADTHTSAADGWSFNDGFARPGRFRIWQPSRELTDYQLEFAGQINERAMSWACRATDENNYYGSRLVVTKPGPLPEVHLMRWVKVNGEDLKRLTLRLPMTVRTDTLYTVHVTLNGPDISMAVNGVMVDAWTDEHFSSGGVAFFASRGEASLLRYVTVTQRDTLIGRILAFLGMVHPSGGLTSPH